MAAKAKRQSRERLFVVETYMSQGDFLAGSDARVWPIAGVQIAKIIVS